MKTIKFILILFTLLNISLNSIETQSLNFTKLKYINGHTSTIDTLIKLNDKEIATGSYDSTIKIWDLREEKAKFTLTDHTSAIYCLAKLNDDLIASGSADKTIKVWNSTNGSLIRTLTDHSGPVISLIRLNDRSSVFLSGSLDKTFKMRFTNDWNEIKTFNTQSQSVRRLLALNSNQIAVANDDFKIRIYELISGKMIFEMSGHSSYIRALTQLNENEIISGSDDKTVKLWNTKEGSLVRTLVTLSAPIRSLLSLNNDYMVVGLGAYSNNLVLINEAKNWRIEYYLVGHSSTVTSLVQLNSNQKASVSDDKSIVVWQSTLSITIYKQI